VVLQLWQQQMRDLLEQLIGLVYLKVVLYLKQCSPEEPAEMGTCLETTSIELNSANLFNPEPHSPEESLAQ
jgi:hypothetical protein